jgi:hypothetical protein
VIAGDEPLEKLGNVHDRPLVTRVFMDVHNLHRLGTHFQHDDWTEIVALYSSHIMVELMHIKQPPDGRNGLLSGYPAGRTGSALVEYARPFPANPPPSRIHNV